MSRKPIANPLLDVDGYIDPVNLINPYAFAAAPATLVAVTSFTTGTPRNDFAGAVGFAFEVGASDLTVAHLGRWKISGNTGIHTVVIVADDFTTVVASANVDLTTGSAGDFVYEELGSPVVLDAEGVYYIASTETESGDTWYNTAASNVTPSGDLSITASIFANTGSYFFSTTGAANSAFVPPNFKYTI